MMLSSMDGNEDGSSLADEVGVNNVNGLLDDSLTSHSQHHTGGVTTPLGYEFLQQQPNQHRRNGSGLTSAQRSRSPSFTYTSQSSASLQPPQHQLQSPLNLTPQQTYLGNSPRAPTLAHEFATSGSGQQHSVSSGDQQSRQSAYPSQVQQTIPPHQLIHLSSPSLATPIDSMDLQLTPSSQNQQQQNSLMLNDNDQPMHSQMQNRLTSQQQMQQPQSSQHMLQQQQWAQQQQHQQQQNAMQGSVDYSNFSTQSRAPQHQQQQHQQQQMRSNQHIPTQQHQQQLYSQTQQQQYRSQQQMQHPSSGYSMPPHSHLNTNMHTASPNQQHVLPNFNFATAPNQATMDQLHQQQQQQYQSLMMSQHHHAANRQPHQPQHQPEFMHSPHPLHSNYSQHQQYPHSPYQQEQKQQPPHHSQHHHSNVNSPPVLTPTSNTTPSTASTSVASRSRTLQRATSIDVKQEVQSGSIRKAAPAVIDAVPKYSVSIILRTGDKSWPARDIVTSLDVSFSQLLYSASNITTFDSLTVAETGEESEPASDVTLADHPIVQQALSHLDSPSSAGSGSSTNPRTLALVLTYDLGSNVKSCTRLGCPRFLLKKASRRACDHCQTHGFDLTSKQIRLLHLQEPVLTEAGRRQIEARVSSGEITSAAATKELLKSTNHSSSLGVMLDRALHRVDHWKFESASENQVFLVFPTEALADKVHHSFARIEAEQMKTREKSNRRRTTGNAIADDSDSGDAAPRHRTRSAGRGGTANATPTGTTSGTSGSATGSSSGQGDIDHSKSASGTSHSRSTSRSAGEIHEIHGGGLDTDDSGVMPIVRQSPLSHNSNSGGSNQLTSVPTKQKVLPLTTHMVYADGISCMSDATPFHDPSAYTVRMKSHFWKLEVRSAVAAANGKMSCQLYKKIGKPNQKRGQHVTEQVITTAERILGLGGRTARRRASLKIEDDIDQDYEPASYAAADEEDVPQVKREVISPPNSIITQGGTKSSGSKRRHTQAVASTTIPTPSSAVVSTPTPFMEVSTPVHVDLSETASLMQGIASSNSMPIHQPMMHQQLSNSAGSNNLNVSNDLLQQSNVQFAFTPNNLISPQLMTPISTNNGGMNMSLTPNPPPQQFKSPHITGMNMNLNGHDPLAHPAHNINNTYHINSSNSVLGAVPVSNSISESQVVVSHGDFARMQHSAVSATMQVTPRTASPPRSTPVLLIYRDRKQLHRDIAQGYLGDAPSEGDDSDSRGDSNNGRNGGNGGGGGHDYDNGDGGRGQDGSRRDDREDNDAGNKRRKMDSYSNYTRQQQLQGGMITARKVLSLQEEKGFPPSESDKDSSTIYPGVSSSAAPRSSSGEEDDEDLDDDAASSGMLSSRSVRQQHQQEQSDRSLAQRMVRDDAELVMRGKSLDKEDRSGDEAKEVDKFEKLTKKDGTLIDSSSTPSFFSTISRLLFMRGYGLTIGLVFVLLLGILGVIFLSANLTGVRFGFSDPNASSNPMKLFQPVDNSASIRASLEAQRNSAMTDLMTRMRSSSSVFNVWMMQKQQPIVIASQPDGVIPLGIPSSTQAAAAVLSTPSSSSRPTVQARTARTRRQSLQFAATTMNMTNLSGYIQNATVSPQVAQQLANATYVAQRCNECATTAAALSDWATAFLGIKSTVVPFGSVHPAYTVTPIEFCDRVDTNAGRQVLYRILCTTMGNTPKLQPYCALGDETGFGGESCHGIIQFLLSNNLTAQAFQWPTNEESIEKISSIYDQESIVLGTQCTQFSRTLSLQDSQTMLHSTSTEMSGTVLTILLLGAVGIVAILVFLILAVAYGVNRYLTLRHLRSPLLSPDSSSSANAASHDDRILADQPLANDDNSKDSPKKPDDRNSILPLTPAPTIVIAPATAAAAAHQSHVEMV